MLKPNSMQNCTTPLSFARGQKEKTISNVNSISGAIGKKDKRQDVDPEDCDENDEAFEDQDDESPTQFRTSKRRKCSVRAHQSIPHSQSRIMDHAAKKLCIQFQPSRKGNERFTKTSSSMNEKGLVSHLSKKLPNDATYVQDSAQKTSHVNLNVAIPQSNHPNGTGISNISSKLRVKETTAVTMEKSDRNDDNDVADDVTLSIEPLGLDDLFVEEVDAYESNRDVRDILIRQQIKGSRFVDKTIAKHDSRNCGGVKSSNADPKSKIDQSSSNDLSDETPMIEPDFCANVRSVERDGVEYQNILSPLTPLSDSSILPTDSIHSIPQVEVPISPIAVDGSDTVTSDGGTQYYISESESEEETDRGGLLKTFAQSIWGIFSVASSDEA